MSRGSRKRLFTFADSTGNRPAATLAEPMPAQA